MLIVAPPARCLYLSISRTRCTSGNHQRRRKLVVFSRLRRWILGFRETGLQYCPLCHSSVNGRYPRCLQGPLGLRLGFFPVISTRLRVMRPSLDKLRDAVRLRHRRIFLLTAIRTDLYIGGRSERAVSQNVSNKQIRRLIYPLPQRVTLGVRRMVKRLKTTNGDSRPQ